MKWLLRNKNTIIVTILILVGIPIIIHSYGLWLLSYASPKIYENLYPKEDNDSIVEPSVTIVHISDTTYVGNQPIISHKEISVENREPEFISSEKPTAEQLGVLGDSAGLWNALFSALALFGVIISICYQTYRDSKNEKANQLSHFQDEFYRLIDCLSRVVVEIEIRIDTSDKISEDLLARGGWSISSEVHDDEQHLLKESIKGRECFRYVYMDNPTGSMKSYSESPDKPDYERFDSYFANYFSHYFRLLYRILRYIDTSTIIKNHPKCNDIKQEYYGILKAHLSTFELLVMYYNGLLNKNIKAKELYEKSCMFDNLDERLLLYENERIYFAKIKEAKWLDEVPQNNILERCYESGAIKRLKQKPIIIRIKRIIASSSNVIYKIFWSDNAQVDTLSSLSEDEKRVLSCLENSKGYTFNQLKQRLKDKGAIEETKLMQILVNLLKSDKIDSRKEGRNTYYYKI